MKKASAKLLIPGVAFAFALAGSGIAKAQPRSHSRVYVPSHNQHISHDYRPQVVSSYRSPYRYGYVGSPYYSVGYWPYYSNYGYYGYYGYGYPGIGVSYTTYSNADSPGYALGGAVLGGVLGGIIGNNSGRGNTLAGAAIGSTIGLLAGSAADDAAVRRQRADRDAAQAAANNAEIARPTRVAQPETPPPQQPQRVVVPAATTPMSQANALFGRQ